MTSWIRRRVASRSGRLPLSAYDTVLRDTPARRAISPMFSAWASGLAGVDRLLRWAIRGALRTSVIARMAAGSHDNPGHGHSARSANRFDARSGRQRDRVGV